MKVFENISLKDYNTFGIDVKARRVVVLEPGDEVPALEGEVLILGGGSNMVFARDFDGTVVTLAHSSDSPRWADSSANRGGCSGSTLTHSSVSPRWTDSSPNLGEQQNGAKYQEPTVTHSSVSPDGAATSPNLGEELDGANFAPLRSQAVSPMEPGRGEELDGCGGGGSSTLTHSSVSPDGAATSPNLGEQQNGYGGVGGGVVVCAWGGMVMDDLVQWTLDQGFYGLENLSAIPGTVGASAVQNVGAYGVEAKDFIESVEAYDLQERRHCSFSNADCQFAYRDSYFKHHPNRYLILRVTYRLSREFVPNLGYKALEGLPHDTAQQLREAITEVRWQKLPRPEEHGSAGSFFKNPVVDEATYRRLREQYPDMPEAHSVTQPLSYSVTYKLSAGWLIDRAGWKGRMQGRAGVWPKNALVLYNADDCTGDDVRALAKAIQQDVKQKFGVALDPEAIII